MFINKFIENAKKYEHKYAIICNNEKITYDELDQKSSYMAAIIKKLYYNKSVIPIYVDRSIDMAILIIAIWKCKKAYFLLDPSWGQTRIEELMNILNVDYLLTIDKYKYIEKQLKSIQVTNIQYMSSIKADIEIEKREDYIDVERKEAYIFFTSGSTGTPKGAIIEHIGMMNHMLAKIRDIGIEEGDRIAQTANIGFNILNWQMFAALYVGGTTVIYDKECLDNPKRLLERLRLDAIDYIQITPSYLDVLNSCLKNVDEGLSSLKMLLLTGESLKSSQINAVFKNNKNICILNSYGCTEVSDDSFHKIYKHEITDDIVTVGKPIPNTYVYVVKEGSCEDKPVLCDKNEVGVIWLAGDIPVGRGYVNNIEENEKYFGKDPFTGERLFRINDLGYFNDEGELICLGRKDSQVKINGTRINITEIENKILDRAKEIKQVAVKEWKNDKGDSYLVGYIVSDKQYCIKELRGFNGILKDIPQIMVPSFWVQLDKMPILESGKIDKISLPKPIAIVKEEADNHVIIRENTCFAKQQEEVMIAELWEEVLQYKELGIRADNIDINECFFNLGGDSISAMLFSTLLEEKGYELNIEKFSQASAISERRNYLKKISREEVRD